MKWQVVIFSALIFLPNTGFTEGSHFVSAVQLAVDESSPELLRRSQRIVIQEFNNTLEQWPELEGVPYDVRTNGNEIAFFITTQDNRWEMVQGLVNSMIGELTGRVKSRGRSMLYLAPLLGDEGGSLEVMGHPSNARIRSVTAHSVPFKDVLKVIKSRLRSVSLSYVIPSNCANREVDWSFGNPLEKGGQDADTVLGKLAEDMHLEFEKTRNNSYVFKGDCLKEQARRPLTQAEIIRASFLPGNTLSKTPHIFVPLMPIGD